MTEIEKVIAWQDLSSRTRSKIIKRAIKSGCAVCGWNESTLDTHHIKHVKDGGKDCVSNLICLCPNCHRCIHTIPNWKTDDELYELSLKDLDWVFYYNPKKRWKQTKNIYSMSCNVCKKDFQTKTRSQKYCSHDCSNHAARKVKRPDKDTLDKMIKKHTMVYIGRKYGVSDNAVRKWANQYGIEWKKLKKWDG